MAYTWEVGKKSYDLKLTTLAVVEVEQKLGHNILMIFANPNEIPPVKTMAIIIQAAMKWKKELSLNQIYSLIDEYIEEGKTMYDIVNVLVETFIESGLIERPKEQKKDDEENESKN